MRAHSFEWVPCPLTSREVPALLLKMQPAWEARFPVRLRFPVQAMCQ
ncbi:unnamed protein product [Staurois parvus]|uniref:Uncharacterized protein n=1 Tax=Staurois parvus TaxID=386267 RepID=A0ABN9HSV0_9NEOB|nr:unnamed protein product [Staurois parvus]